MVDVPKTHNTYRVPGKHGDAILLGVKPVSQRPGTEPETKDGDTAKGADTPKKQEIKPK